MMKCFTKKMVLVFAFVSVALAAQSQKRSFSVVPNVGIATNMTDDKINFQFGLNSGLSISPNIDIEGQISFRYTDAIDGSIKTRSALIGGKFYMAEESNKTRGYLNLLVGRSFNRESISDYEVDEYKFGYSGGIFLEMNKLLIGLSYETPQALVFKLGYIFN